jgi:hypothetical protein
MSVIVLPIFYKLKTLSHVKYSSVTLNPCPEFCIPSIEFNVLISHNLLARIGANKINLLFKT